ncbi:MAG: YlxR family protein [Chloroflexales bacterium]
MGQIAHKQGGLRAKHVPQRTCIACRRTDAKRGLIRLVRTPEGRIEVDTTGKRNGRGAYLCHDPACWDAAIKRRALERSLRVEPLTPENQRDLLAYSRGLTAAEAHGADTNTAEELPHAVRV